MRYGFLVDNQKCIGCHACSTACKSENSVPLGVQRTWVKTVETGKFPDTTRHFQVTRCNHCENPPCVAICPVSAMYQRQDGIVEFDSDRCIGCKACIHACPYDAIYLDPESNTAAKCHFCAHRVEVGLEPACVIVCPEHAIVAGDMDDPDSEISRLLAKNAVSVRKPEQGTSPKLFYVGGNDAALIPTATELPSLYMASDVVDQRDDGLGKKNCKSQVDSDAEKKMHHQGAPARGPLNFGGLPAEQMVQSVFNAQHRMYWGWQVPAYIIAKDAAAGAFILGSGIFFAGSDLELNSGNALSAAVILGVVLLLTMITTSLLVIDLGRPERFLRILTRPQWRSWLTRGGYLLVTFSMLVGACFALSCAVFWGFKVPELLLGMFRWSQIVGVPLALMVSVYTAFCSARPRVVMRGKVLCFRSSL